MKKVYESPVAEKVTFQYQEQVVASNGSEGCTSQWVNYGDGSCTSGNAHLEYLK